MSTTPEKTIAEIVLKKQELTSNLSDLEIMQKRISLIYNELGFHQSKLSMEDKINKIFGVLQALTQISDKEKLSMNHTGAPITLSYQASTAATPNHAHPTNPLNDAHQTQHYVGGVYQNSFC